ncbi:MAG TPA: type II toxin-antitoxin system ParD family antitoxin [Planctomycetota bacterium]|nr:type II toxin-antitoxin system ParD family antitoxin [Planctomycetota bacterium]
MNVSLTPELEKFVTKLVKSGNYQSASEVVRDGLRLMQERDEIREAKLQALRADLKLGLDSIERGNVVDGPEAIQRIKARIAARAKAER